MNIGTKIAHLVALALAPIAAPAATMWLAGFGQAPSNTNINNFVYCSMANNSSLGVNQGTGCGGQVILDSRYGTSQGVVASGNAIFSAAATPGTLRAFAEDAVTNLPVASFLGLPSQAWATSSFQDMITVQPLIAAPGTPGFMQPVFSVQGPVSASGSPLGASGGVFVMTGANFSSGEFGDQAPEFAGAANAFGLLEGFFLIDPVGVTANVGTAQGRTFTSNPIPIIFGTPHAFSAHLEAWTMPCGNCNGFTPSQLISFTGTADLSHTAVLTGFIITDAAGNPLQGSSITGTGGFDYNSIGGSAAAPEPATWTLLAVAAVGLLLRSRRKRQPSIG